MRRFLPRPLRARLRKPSIILTAAALLALVTGSAVFRFLSAAEAGARRFGDPVEVAVARAPLDPGTDVTAAQVDMRLFPSSAVPAGALHSSPVGRVVRRPVGSGEMLVAADLAGPGTSPLAGAIPHGRVAMAFGVPDAALRLRPGDVVDLMSVPAAGADGEGFAIASTGAIVLAVDHAAVTVAIPIADASAVASAVVAGVVVPALHGDN